MWPKRKKGKARTTKLKLKAMQPPDQQQDGLESDAGPEVGAQVKDPRSQQDELVSGVWKSKVLTNYKQNPKNSHTLLARIPTGKAAFEAGERQKAELIKEAMIKVVDRMFDNFQNTAYEFNQVTTGSNLELTWIRPQLVQEELSNWHETSRATIEVFSGRISTRYWTLAVRGTSAGIETYILPSDKLLGFSTNPTNYPTYLTLVSESDGLAVDWIVAKKAIDPEILPSIYRALLDGLIRFASEEAQPGEAFRLEDIGIVPEALAPVQEAVGYQSQDGSKHELLGQSEPIISAPNIGQSSADRFIDNISNQVAQAAQSETDKFRESLQAPPFGTNTRSTGEVSQPGRSNSLQPGDFQQTPGFQDPPAFQQGQNLSQSGGNGSDKPADDFGEWKTVGSDQAVKADWRNFMDATKEQLKNQPAAAPARDDSWNSVPGTEKLARPETRNPFESQQQPQQMSNSQVMQGIPYPSYGNATDPPVLLKPADQQISQSGGYPVHPAGQSGVNSAQPQQGYPGQPGVGQSGVYTTQQAINQSGIFSGQQPQMPPQLPPQMMPPGYNMGMPQQMPGMIQPGMVNNPGLPSLPGMINPGIGQSGVHQAQPQPPQGMSPAAPPPGLALPNQPQGMMQMPPQMVPGFQGDMSGQYANQSSTGGHGALPPQYPDQRAVSQQGQSNTGAQQALPSQYSTGSQPSLPQYNTGGQPAQQQQPQYSTGAQPVQQQPQYNTGSQQALPPQYSNNNNAAYNTDAHQQLQYAQGGYEAFAQPTQQPAATVEDQSYLLSESDVNEQEHQYPDADEFPEEGAEEGWQPEEETSIESEEEASWEEPASSPFANSSFPQESFNELPVVSTEALQKFEAASKSGFVFSSENDLVDAISVVLGTIDAQIELLAEQGTEAFRSHDFRRAQSIIKLSERLTSFKEESQTILQLMADNEEQ